MRLLSESVFIPIEKRTLILKIGEKISISYETKVLMPFSLISRMSLWHPIMERNEIIM